MQPTSRIIHLMGTIIETRIWHHDAESILDQVEQLLYLYKDRFSANDLTSELMEVNLNAGVQAVPVAADLYELIAFGKEHSLAKGSFLNIAIGPLVQSWRIGFPDARIPSHDSIAKKLELIDPQDIVLNDADQTVYLRKVGMAIDLGALAKGYVADKIVEFLKAMGVTSGLLNLGGNVRTVGEPSHHSDGYWRIGIQDPHNKRGKNALVLKISEGSVVTSGVYERTLTIKDKVYHHIFNTETGYPMETQIASLSIISKKSLDGEVWTTRLFGAAIEEILETVHNMLEIEAVIIDHSGQVFLTAGLTSMVEHGDLVISDSFSSSTIGGFGMTVRTDVISGASVL